MNISITPHLEEWIQSKVDSGLYSSSSEVVREALRRQCEEEANQEKQLNALRAELQTGLDQLKRGEYDVFDKSLVEKLKAEARAERSNR